MAELDLTNAHLPNLDSTTLAPTLTFLDLTANRLETIDPRIIALTSLTSLNFRQNLLSDVSSFADSASKGVIEDLEFRDNHLKEIPKFEGFVKLRRLEFSYNEVSKVASQAAMAAQSAPLATAVAIACPRVAPNRK